MNNIYIARNATIKQTIISKGKDSTYGESYCIDIEIVNDDGTIGRIFSKIMEHAYINEDLIRILKSLTEALVLNATVDVFYNNSGIFLESTDNDDIIKLLGPYWQII